MYRVLGQYAWRLRMQQAGMEGFTRRWSDSSVRYRLRRWFD
jgi:hypothetical protein